MYFFLHCRDIFSTFCEFFSGYPLNNIFVLFPNNFLDTVYELFLATLCELFVVAVELIFWFRDALRADCCARTETSLPVFQDGGHCVVLGSLFGKSLLISSC